MKAKKANPARRPAKDDTADLRARYGKIGISAVAAAVRYRGEPRKVEVPRGESRIANGEWRIAGNE